MKWSIAAFFLFLLPVTLDAQAEAQDWRALPDAPDPGAALQFNPMPPGWHLTTGSGVLVANPGVTTPAGRYAIETEAFLFPGTSAGAYGLFLGGSNVERAHRSYVAFLVRRDGSAAVVRRRGETETVLVEWTRADSLPPQSGQEAVRAVLSVGVDADSVRFHVNGGRVAALARTEVAPDGAFGLRVESNVNLHVTRLDAIRRFAPPRGG